MEADWSVELGADDPVLDMPWVSPDATLRWQDLRRSPELIAQLPECRAYSEFIGPLRALNSSDSSVVTAKCDAYEPEPTEPAEDLYGSWRLVSYLDFLFAAPAKQNLTVTHGSTRLGDSEEAGELQMFDTSPANFDFALHEQFARDLSPHLEDSPETDPQLNGTAEIVIRRCIYNGTREGFYFTLYIIGYGDSGDEARQHWSRVLAHTASAVVATARSLITGS